MFKPHRLKGGTFFGGGMFFQKTPVFEGWYVYLGRYVFEKLPRRGGGTLIWGGSFIWQWIVISKPSRRNGTSNVLASLMHRLVPSTNSITV